jgi:hypothetical protein
MADRQAGEKAMKIGWAVLLAAISFCFLVSVKCNAAVQTEIDAKKGNYFSSLVATEDDVTLRLFKGDPNSPYIVLNFANHSKMEVDLEFAPEGAGNCDEYFEIDAINENGRNAPKSLLYVPGFPPYIVRLKPWGHYSHWIQPRAYLNGTRLETLTKIRVKYTNRITGQSILSDWLLLDKK